jgi:transcriptional regulator GlxA family with amidase domain
MKVDVLALDGVFDTGLAAALDAFGTARELAADEQVLEVRIVGVRPRVRTSWGLEVAAGELDPGADVVFVAGLAQEQPGKLVARLEAPDARDAVEALRGAVARGAQVAAACTGTWLLAESGALDGQPATTSWWLAPAFRRRYPAVALDPDAMVVPAGQCVTAGAALAHLDLALHLVRQLGPTLAHTVARYLVSQSRTSQAAYVIPDQLAHDDPLVRRFEEHVRAHASEALRVDDVARRLGTSPRTLSRRVAAVLGKTPVDVVQAIRADQAVHLLQTTDWSVDRVANEVGYAHASTLRAVLREVRGLGVRQIRG